MVPACRRSVYLLEKPRIVNHLNGERNYHVLYMLCKASLAGLEVRIVRTPRPTSAA